MPQTNISALSACSVRVVCGSLGNHPLDPPTSSGL